MTIAFQHLPSVVGLVDVGTAKVVCVLLVAGDDGRYDVAGIGHQRSHGLAASAVVDADAAKAALEVTIAQAAHMAGAEPQAVILALSGGSVASRHLTAELPLAEGIVTAETIKRMRAAAQATASRSERTALLAEAIALRVDGSPVSLPGIGRGGTIASADLNVVSSDRSAVRDLVHLVERCGPPVVEVVPAAIATALAVTTDREREDGVLVIDLGAGRTGMALYRAGTCIDVHALPVGAQHLTYDLARSLSVSLDEAERIKANHGIAGIALPSAAGPNAGMHGDHQSNAIAMTRANTTDILSARVAEVFDQVALRIETIGAERLIGSIALAGGGSALRGLPEYVTRRYGFSARVARPILEVGSPSILGGHAFTVAAGLMPMVTGQRRIDGTPAGVRNQSNRRPWTRPVVPV